MTRQRPFFYGWIILAIGFLTIVGGYFCRTTFSVFYPAIVDEFGWTRGNAALIFSLNVLVYGLCAPFAGAIADRFQPRFVLAAGAVLMGIGMVSCSLATARWQFFLLYGVVAAVGLSVAGWAPVSALLTGWFARRRALAFGILGAGFGLGLIGSYAAQYLISSFGWRTAYVVIGLCIAALIAPLCIVFLRRAPVSAGLQQDTSPTTDRTSSSAVPAADSAGAWRRRDWTLRAAAHTRQFWLLFLSWLVLFGVVEQLTIAHQVYFYLDAGYAPMSAAAFYGIFGVCVALGNLAGAVSDRVGRERVFIPCCVIGAAFASLYFLMKDTSLPWLPPVIAAGLGTTFGALCCVLNAALADLFSGKHYGKIAGSMIVGFATGGTLSPWLAGHLHDITGNYTTTYAILVAGLLVTATLMWLVAPRKLHPIARSR